MNSSLISKIDKAKRYEREPERIKFQNLEVTFDGENSTHQVSLKDQQWNCNCGFFPRNGTCSHVMAMQRILAPMLSSDARYGPDPGMNRPLPEHEGESSEAITTGAGAS